jgi:fatty-acyl-CoA synthase
MSDPDISPATAVAYLARCDPAAASIVSDQRTLSRRDVDQATVTLAGTLAGGGVTPGTRVAYVGRNSPEVLLTLLACAHLGAVFVPVNFRLAAGELRYVLAHSGAHTVLVEADCVPTCVPIAAELPVARWLIAEGGTPVPDGPPGWLPARPVVDVASAAAPPVRLARTFDDLAVIMYTSGTSGRPKGVMLSHGNLWWNSVNVDEVFDTRTDDVNLAIAPMFHIGGLNAFTLRTLVRGGTVLVRRTFDAARTLSDLSERGVTSVFGVPAMFAAVARCPGFRKADLSGVRAAIVAGAPVPAPLITEYAAHGLLLQQCWGMTETAAAATFVPAGRVLDEPGSAGLPLPRTRIRLVDPDTAQRVDRAGPTGEIQVRGPNVTMGYWNDEAATRAAFTDDGWLRTNDLARLDPQGQLWVLGRRSEMINSGGEKILAGEVERALAGLPGVTDLAVFGAPDPVWGEVVAVALECPDGDCPTVDDVRAYGSERIARYKLPRRVCCLPDLPRNGGGKVDKSVLRAWFVTS